MRAEFQVLIIPFIREDYGKIKFIIFKRTDDKSWQFIAGGGENRETPLEAAKRETKEEADIDSNELIILRTLSMIPINVFRDHKDKKGLYVIPEYCFGVEIKNKLIDISEEHTEYKFVSYDEAVSLLRYDGNKTALWELNERIKKNDLLIG